MKLTLPLLLTFIPCPSLAQAQTIDSLFLEQTFGATSTEASRVASWDRIEGKQAIINAQVLDVEAPGIFTPFFTVILNSGGSIEYYCMVDNSVPSKVVELRKGDEFTCIGKLKQYVYVLGSAAVYIEAES